jgi:hypothetical protein
MSLAQAENDMHQTKAGPKSWNQLKAEVSRPALALYDLVKEIALSGGKSAVVNLSLILGFVKSALAHSRRPWYIRANWK